MFSPLTKVKKAFHKGKYEKIYLREKESNEINKFLNSDEKILHICGNPGTGKTCTVLSIIKDIKYSYYNFFENPTEKNKIIKSRSRIIVIDEFDKLYNTNRKDSIELLDFIQKSNKKLITISNTLDLYENILFFKAYKFEEILFIIKKKIEDDVGIEIADDYVLSIIAKKFSNSGDIRRTFEYIKNLIEKKADENSEKIELVDTYDDKENDVNKNNENINHRIIKEIAEKCYKGKIRDYYSIYLKECLSNKIPHLGRADFIVIYELYKSRK